MLNHDLETGFDHGPAAPLAAKCRTVSCETRSTWASSSQVKSCKSVIIQTSVNVRIRTSRSRNTTC